MSLFRHYVRQWTSLPPEERQIRVRRVVERWFRRDPRIRSAAASIGITPENPSWRRFRGALSVDAEHWALTLRASDPRRHPLWADLAPRAAAAASSEMSKAAGVLARAEILLDRRFDLLGSGPARPLRPDDGIDWHRDFKSGRGWDPSTWYLDVETVRGDGSDVKVPWELSRSQHLLILGQAWHLAPHLLTRPAADALRHRVAAEIVAQIDDWIVQNPAGCGVNWACTMDVAIRAVNWIGAIALIREAPEAGDAFLLRAVRALWVHGRFIRANLEVAADGSTSNRYLSDLAGLLAIGTAFPELRDSARWRQFAWDSIRAEMWRQVHPDGVDFERSLPYHRLVAEIFVHATILARAAGETVPDEYTTRLAGMLEFSAACTRSDGTTPCWGDEDDGRLFPLDAPNGAARRDHRHLLVLGGRCLGRDALSSAGRGGEWEAAWLLGQAPAPAVNSTACETREFRDAGYVVIRDRDVHVGVGCGPVGTRGLGNHTHNDLFAPCFYAAGREWIADPGTGSYTADPALRNRMRSVAAHAAVQIDDLEPNPFGSTLDDLFRMRDGAGPEWEVRLHGDAPTLTGRHRGYAPGGRGWVHEREIVWEPKHRALRIDDRLSRTGEGAAARTPTARARFPLAPGVTLDFAERGQPLPGPAREILDAYAGEADLRAALRGHALLFDGVGRRCLVAWSVPDGAEVSVAPGEYSPSYGVVTATSALVIAFEATDAARCITLWIPEPVAPSDP